MSFDNRLFNVNGRGSEMLLAALKLAFAQESRNDKPCVAYRVNEKGITLLWHAASGSTPLPAPMSAEQVMPIVTAWLDSEPKVTLEQWEEDIDHDGHNGAGWRVYVENWGHVGNEPYALCAVKPVFLWYGK